MLITRKRRYIMKWVRPAISLIGVLGITIGFFLKMVSPESYLSLVTLAVVWWFKSRDTEKQNHV